MAVVNVCSLAGTDARSFNGCGGAEFAAVVTSDRLEYFSEILSELTFKVIKHSDGRCSGFIIGTEHKLFSGFALGEYKESISSLAATDHGIKLPMAEIDTGEDTERPLFD